jgi:cell division protein FtsB
VNEPVTHERTLRRRIGYGLAVFALALFVLSSARLAVARHDLAERARAIELSTDRLQAQNAELLTELADLRTDAGIERLARESLDWAKPGETVTVEVGASPRRADWLSPDPGN